MSGFAVAGLGLIGGSLALALPARGFDRDPAARRRARERGIRCEESLAAALEGADVVFLAVPTAQTPALLSEAAALRPGALFSDCASLKAPVVRSVDTLPTSVRFVGGHPMAGSRTRGLEGALQERTGAVLARHGLIWRTGGGRRNHEVVAEREGPRR